jgi:quinol monooxygenase YgiN
MIGCTVTIAVIATFHPVEGRRDELADAALAAVPAVLAEPGCLQYEPHTVGRSGLVILERWESGDALRAHGAGEPLARFRTATEHLVTAPADIVVARPVTAGATS